MASARSHVPGHICGGHPRASLALFLFSFIIATLACIIVLVAIMNLFMMIKDWLRSHLVVIYK